MSTETKFNPVGEIEKVWGSETLLVSNELYCAKFLTFAKAGNKFSMHFHMDKDETWIVQKGSFMLELIDTEDASTQRIPLSTNTSMRIYPGTIHQLEALEDESVILEVSTTDNPHDNYRVWPGVAK